MIRIRTSSILATAVLIVGVGCTEKEYTSTQSRPSDAPSHQEVPFVAGQPAPIPPSGFAWCLENRDAVRNTVREQVLVRAATSYYEAVSAQYESRPERILVEPEQQKTVLVCPAVYRDVPEQRVCAAATVEYRTIPAQYRWVNEETEVVPERTEKTFIPAQYGEETERIQVKPEHTTRGKVNGCDIDGGQLECYSSRTNPAEYTTITKKRMTAPASTQTRIIPAVRRNLRVCKVVSPARVEKVDVPARYETVMKKVLERPAEYRTETIPARYRTIEKKVMVTPETQRLVQVPAKYDTVCREEVIQPMHLVWVLKEQKQLDCPL